MTRAAERQKTALHIAIGDALKRIVVDQRMEAEDPPVNGAGAQYAFCILADVLKVGHVPQGHRRLLERLTHGAEDLGLPKVNIVRAIDNLHAQRRRARAKRRANAAAAEKALAPGASVEHDGVSGRCPEPVAPAGPVGAERGVPEGVDPWLQTK